MQITKLFRRVWHAKWHTHRNFQEQLKRLSVACKVNFKLAPETHRVLFIHMHSSDYLLALEGVLVNRLRLEGVEPAYLSCSSLPLCNNRRYFTAPDHSELCAQCNQRNHNNAIILGCDLKEVGEFESDNIRYLAHQATESLSLEQCLDFTWEGVPLGKLCAVSTSRFLCREARNITTASDLWYFRRFLESGIILADSLRRALLFLKPTVIVQNSGRFFWYAIADHLARENKIGVVSYEGDGGFGRTWMFRSKVPVSSLEIGEIWSAERDLRLTDGENEKLEKLIHDRRTGAMIKGFCDKGVFAFEPSLPPQLASISGPIIALFTNLTFDSQVSERHTIFNGVVDWLIYTIQNVSSSDATFVIRIHPAEAHEHEGEYSRERIMDELRDKGIRIPKNVVLIPPGEKINSYVLAERAQLSVVYTSTIGLELLIAGHQVVVCGLAHYSNKGFGINPTSKEEYISKIIGVKEKIVPSIKEIELAKSYGYTFWFKAVKPLQAFTTQGRFQVDQLLFDRPSKISRGTNVSLDEVIDMILLESKVAQN